MVARLFKFYYIFFPIQIVWGPGFWILKIKLFYYPIGEKNRIKMCEREKKNTTKLRGIDPLV